MTNEATDPASEEGPSTAAYDFNDARFRIHQVKEKIRQAELSRRRGQVSLATVAPALLAVLVALNLAWFAGRSPVHMNIVVLVAGNVIAGIALLAALLNSLFIISDRGKTITKSRLHLAQLREAERDARTSHTSS